MEGIILIISFIIGGLTALLAAFFLVASAVRQSKTMFKIGLSICLIPLSLYGLSYWYYDVHIPRLTKRMEEKYSGTYLMVQADNKTLISSNVKLILSPDNTFQLDENDIMPCIGRGKWKAAATDDGQFEFKDNFNSTQFFASPYNDNRLVINEHFIDRQKVTFMKQ